jgi:hypothetical protein
MLKLTVHAALHDQIGDYSGHVIYLYRDDETVLYVGRSSDPINRLTEHMGMGRSAMSRLGRLIHKHMPQSLDWSLEIYTLADCVPLVERQDPATLGYYQRCLDSEQGFIEQCIARQSEQERLMMKALHCEDMHKKAFLAHLYHEIGATAEDAAIAYYHPCLNVLNNSSGAPVPAKYYSQQITPSIQPEE